jgi:hypothetical protein
MRFIALVVMIAAACSGEHYGSYLVVEGDSRITFDHVDFYFGDLLPGRDVPTSPMHVQPATGEQYLHTRIFDPLDSQKLATAQSTFTYYLPASGGNLDLTQAMPPYVMVVASKGDMPVGIGELTDFTLADNQVDQYIIHLEPFSIQTAEVWGQGTPDCVRWERQRDMDPPGQPSTSAVVREHDKDCDGFLDSVDCNRLEYCDPSAPNPANACSGHDTCITTDSCALGNCMQVGPPGDGATQQCIATTCLFGGVCSTSCDPTASVDDRIACALAMGNQTIVEIPLTEQERLCQPSYMFSVPTGNVGCVMPQVVYPVGGKEADGFTITANPDVTNTMACAITISAPTTSDPTFKSDEDVVVEINNTGGSMLLRTTFAFTIRPGPNNIGACAMPPNIIQMGPGVATCP